MFFGGGDFGPGAAMRRARAWNRDTDLETMRGSGGRGRAGVEHSVSVGP